MYWLIEVFVNLFNFYEYELWFVGFIDNIYILILKIKIRELGLINLVKFFDYVFIGELFKIIS